MVNQKIIINKNIVREIKTPIKKEITIIKNII